MIRVDGNGSSSSLVKVRGLNKTYSRGGEKSRSSRASISTSTRATLSPSWAQRLRQDHFAQSPRRSGRTLRGQHYRRRGRNYAHVRQQTHALARAPRRFIFQMYNLIPVLTAFQNVELPLLLTKLSNRSAASTWRQRSAW